MNRWSALAILFCFAGALLFRLPRLESRPLHNDEAVNAVKVAELWQQGRYRYDPDEYHGPTLHYATLPFLRLSDASGPNDLKDKTLRYAPVLFGAALILLLFLYAGALSANALACSALLLAISPAMVFYSRYFIHEILLVFFTALAIGAGWRYTRTRSAVWAAFSGAAVGLMFATKETFVLTLAASAAGTLVAIWPTLPKNRRISAGLALIPKLHLLAALAGAFAIWLLFFSSFFSNWAGLLDSIRTYFPWLKRAAGHSPHLHPWYFYLQRLGWFHSAKGPIFSEGLVLVLSLVGCFLAFRPNASRFLRFVAVYTLTLTAIYSAISYKTPWCLLSFWFGMILLAGTGAAALIDLVRPSLLKAVPILILLSFAAQLGWQSWRASFVFSADRRNPYVYAQTAPDLLNLVRRVQGISEVSPSGKETVIKVMAPESDYWPLPWYLRRFAHIGWYESVPQDPFAPIIIASADLNARLDEKSERKWIMAGITELRPGKFLELYVELDLWKKYVETLPPDPD